MTEDARAWFGRVRGFGRSHLATQAAVLLPVVVLAALTAWAMLSTPTNARAPVAASAGKPRSQTVGQVAQAKAPETAPAQEHDKNAMLASPAPETASPQPAASTEPQAVDGLKISSQSWRRGGLGSNALITFTLRNDNAYAVKDIEIACAFSRRDGSHLTDRKRILPDAVVNMKSRKTFARVHIGFVNIYANKAKCEPVAASRV